MTEEDTGIGTARRDGKQQEPRSSLRRERDSRRRREIRKRQRAANGATGNRIKKEETQRRDVI